MTMSDSSDDGAPRRDESKRKTEAQKVMKKVIDGGCCLFRWIRQHPDLWQSDGMDEFRKMAYEVTGDPEKYPPPKEEDGWGVELDSLSKNIGELLFSKGMPIMKPTSDAIYLQITHSNFKQQTNIIDNCTVNHRQWRGVASDGDKMSIVMRIDSTLNTAGNLLAPGTIVLVQSYLPVYFRYDVNDDKSCAIVVRKFEVVGRRPVPSELAGPPKHRVVPKKEKKQPTRKPPKKKQRVETKSDEASVQECCCNGQLCSQHGVEFVVCLTECVPTVQSVSLALIARECVFVTKKLSEMTPSDKRFLLYYYYATTIYQFHGKGNRVELPECLKNAVRTLYPNEEQIIENGN